MSRRQVHVWFVHIQNGPKSFINLPTRCVAFIADTFRTATAGGRGSPPYAEILNPMGEYFAEAATRADAAVRPYAEDLDRVASFEIHPGTKKTTHASHRRFAFTSVLSTADVTTLPNWAGFCIWDGFTAGAQNNNWSPSDIHNSIFVWFTTAIYG